jgi:DNA-binding response OmpR family regulator
MRRILIVEEDQPLREIIAEYFREIGYSVDSVETRSQGARLVDLHASLNEYYFGIVINVQQVYHYNDMSLAQMVQSVYAAHYPNVDKVKDLPILFLTDGTDDTHEECCKMLGLQSIDKGIFIQRIVEKVQKFENHISV